MQTLRRVWVERFYRDGKGVQERGDAPGRPPAAGMISSPDARDARDATTRTTSWTGDKVHLSETCDADRPHLSTHVETAPAPAADGDAPPPIHRALDDKGLPPALPIVDTGYLDAALLRASRTDYDVELLGPTRRDQRWQARAKDGFGMAAFAVDWERRRAPCPGGRESVQWDERVDERGNDRIDVRFSKAECGPCPVRAPCTKAERRSIAIRPRAQDEAVHERRARQETPAFAAEYARRAGIEGTISPGVRAFDLRRATDIGAATTQLQHVLTAAAIDVVRVARWLDEVPVAKTRRSSFVKLMNPESAAA